MLILALAESALELVPKGIAKHPSVLRYAERREKKPTEVLLDSSFHHKAMLKLKDSWKRGRPDLVHFSLLEATSIPLYFKGLLKVYVHIYKGDVIEVGDGVRLPKSYHRFAGLMEQLLKEGVVGGERPLLKVVCEGFIQLLESTRPTSTVGLSRKGKLVKPVAIAERLAGEERPLVVIGAFPKGSFSKEIGSRLDEIYSISKYALESHVVVARILYEYEKVKLNNEGQGYHEWRPSSSMD